MLIDTHVAHQIGRAAHSWEHLKKMYCTWEQPGREKNEVKKPCNII